jgi:hypothetical protein
LPPKIIDTCQKRTAVHATRLDRPQREKIDDGVALHIKSNLLVISTLGLPNSLNLVMNIEITMR